MFQLSQASIWNLESILLFPYLPPSIEFLGAVEDVRKIRQWIPGMKDAITILGRGQDHLPKRYAPGSPPWLDLYPFLVHLQPQEPRFRPHQILPATAPLRWDSLPYKVHPAFLSACPDPSFRPLTGSHLASVFPRAQ